MACQGLLIEIKNKVGKELGKLRQEKNLDLKTVAALLNMPQEDIAEMEKGGLINWYKYKRLIAFYRKKLQICLVDADSKKSPA